MTNKPTSITITPKQPITTALAKNLIVQGLGKPRGVSHEDAMLYPPSQRELLKHKCMVYVIRAPRTFYRVVCRGCHGMPFGQALRIPVEIKESASFDVAVDFAIAHYVAHAKLAQERAVTRGKLQFS